MKQPLNWKATALLRVFGFFKIPLLFLVSPTVLELSEKRCMIRIPLRRLTRNHLHSMYLAAFAVGADCAVGLLAMQCIRQTRKPISLIFQSFHAEFLKRAQDDVVFICEQGKKVQAVVDQVAQSTERHACEMEVTAIVPRVSQEIVARFSLTLSLKVYQK